MAWPKGKPRPVGAGRTKGTPNKRSISDDLLEKCAARGIDIFDMLLDVASNKDDPARVNALTTLMKYLYPQKKAIEVSSEPGGFVIKVEEYKF